MREFNKSEMLSRAFLAKKKLLIVSITNKCNLRCIYCRSAEKGDWYDKLSEKKSDDNIIFDNVLHIIKSNDFSEIMLSGGEPFATKNITEFSENLLTTHKSISIHTNGVHPKAITRLLELYRKGIKPNLHISSELFPSHQINFRGCSLPIEFISIAKELELEMELKVVVNPLFLEYIDNIDLAIDFWIEKGIKQIRFQPLAPVGNTPKNLHLTSDHVDIFYKLINLKKQEKYKNVIRNSEESFLAAIKVLNSKTKTIYKDCNMCEKINFITSSGCCVNCASMWGKKSPECNQAFDLICCGFQP
ncbi:radical SAM protein [Vibrio mimicus]